MFRLQGNVIPDNKVIFVGLTHVYGIGISRSKEILTKLEIPFEKKVRDITDEEQKMITDELSNYLLESDLKREQTGFIKRLKEIKCYRGMRHNLGLPVRGQKTIKHAKTAKKLLGRSRVRPVLKK
ncbi:30S ribosomal protein S13 [Candidatus Vampirococcus lugosii]|uniref:Small ribosomal subunit protein uS13 n=1 Tax=Candidatus Vampirococcus lugosii TaxID=2789015 RepID=A0ABS5QLT8_9BACT|nr:30S ribosomal protein S13 [Candidatus Vampirococcus lugosii]MBS8121444.1 30S ribosomal protein S13 [Candidatus Vampirococcus lugosii]